MPALPAWTNQVAEWSSGLRNTSQAAGVPTKTENSDVSRERQSRVSKSAPVPADPTARFSVKVFLTKTVARSGHYKPSCWPNRPGPQCTIPQPWQPRRGAPGNGWPQEWVTPGMGIINLRLEKLPASAAAAFPSDCRHLGIGINDTDSQCKSSGEFISRYFHHYSIFQNAQLRELPISRILFWRRPNIDHIKTKKWKPLPTQTRCILHGFLSHSIPWEADVTLAPCPIHLILRSLPQARFSARSPEWGTRGLRAVKQLPLVQQVRRGQVWIKEALRVPSPCSFPGSVLYLRSNYSKGTLSSNRKVSKSCLKDTSRIRPTLDFPPFPSHYPTANHHRLSCTSPSISLLLPLPPDLPRP